MLSASRVARPREWTLAEAGQVGSEHIKVALERIREGFHVTARDDEAVDQHHGQSAGRARVAAGDSIEHAVWAGLHEGAFDAAAAAASVDGGGLLEPAPDHRQPHDGNDADARQADEKNEHGSPLLRARGTRPPRAIAITIAKRVPPGSELRAQHIVEKAQHVSITSALPCIDVRGAGDDSEAPGRPDRREEP